MARGRKSLRSLKLIATEMEQAMAAGGLIPDALFEEMRARLDAEDKAEDSAACRKTSRRPTARAQSVRQVHQCEVATAGVEPRVSFKEMTATIRKLSEGLGEPSMCPRAAKKRGPSPVPAPIAAARKILANQEPDVWLFGEPGAKQYPVKDGYLNPRRELEGLGVKEFLLWGMPESWERRCSKSQRLQMLEEVIRNVLQVLHVVACREVSTIEPMFRTYGPLTSHDRLNVRVLVAIHEELQCLVNDYDATAAALREGHR